MKRIYFPFILLIILTSCNNESEDQKNISSEISPLLTQDYNWKDYSEADIFGEVLFLPAYSSVYHQNDRVFDLTVTVTIHNTDLKNRIKIIKIDYYNADGKLVRKFVDDELILGSLQSKQFIVEQSDISGGTAPKFIIQWVSDTKVLSPIVEAVMISTSSQQGISFVTDAKIIHSIGF